MTSRTRTATSSFISSGSHSMSEFKLDQAPLDRALELALLGATQFVQSKIVPITPRDAERLPQNINRKDGLAPTRSTYFKPVSIGGNWYSGISGKLKQSIAHEAVSPLEQKIGVTVGTANAYAKYLEFGTRTMRPRSFLRKGIIDNQKGAMDVFRKLFNSAL